MNITKILWIHEVDLPVRQAFARARQAAALTSLVALSGCGWQGRGFLASRGPIAAEDRTDFIIVAIAMLFVLAPILIGTPLAAWIFRLSKRGHPYRPQWTFSWILEFFIWIPPTLIVIGLSFLSWRETHRLDPYRPISTGKPPIEVQAVGLDWKWLFIYPDQHIAIVNQLALPTDRSLHLTLTSDTVMQSLLIPQLAGQIYAMAGMKTQLNLKADSPGTFLGENTQFNGAGFQKQKFQVLALSPSAYTAWIQQVRATGSSLDDKAYAQLSRKSSPPNPIPYSSVEPGLFAKIIARTQDPDMAQDMSKEAQ